MISIPLDGEHPLRSALTVTAQSYGRTAALSLEDRIRMVGLFPEGQPVRILNLSRSPEQERAVLAEIAGSGFVEHVCTTNSRHLRSDQVPDVHYSETFDSDFWEAIAVKLEPDLIISDGSLSDWHQIAMLKILFPIVASSGSVVLQQHKLPVGGNALTSFLSTLVSTQMSRDRASIERDDATGYLLRNMETVSYSQQGVSINKRATHQKRLEAVPFSAVAKEHQSLDRPETYQRIPARIFGSDKMAARHSGALADHAGVLAPPAEVGRIANALVSGGGIVHTADGYIVEESFINARHAPRRGPFYRIGSSSHYVSENSLDPVRSVEGQAALMKQTWDANYGHWIVDTLPRISHYLSGFDFAGSRVLVNGSTSPGIQLMQAESLELFGVSAEQLLPIDWQTTLVENLIYATPSSIPPLIKSPRSIEILSTLADRLDGASVERFASWDRIYLTRNSYPRRRLINEDILLPFVEQAGYRVVVPESLSFADQVALFSRATHVVGNMGAAFSNLAFSPPGVRVLVLATQHMAHDYFYDLVCHKGGEYYGLQGVAGEPSATAGIGSDFTIDKDAFLSVFGEFDQQFNIGGG